MKNTLFAVLLTLGFAAYADNVEPGAPMKDGSEPNQALVDSYPPDRETAGEEKVPAPKAAATKAMPAPSYTGEAAKIKTQLEKLFVASRDVNAKGSAQKNARDQIENALDWERIAKDCLGPADWKKTSADNQMKYRDLLHQVVVRTAFTRLDTFWDGASYYFSKIDVKGNEAHVVANFKVKGDDFALDYYLGKKGSTWTVYDIAFEEMRYSENIREQIKAFLKEKGFPNLLAQLRKRLNELDEGTKAEKTSSIKKKSRKA